MDNKEREQLFSLLYKYKKELKCGRKKCPICKYRTRDLECTIIELMDDVEERAS